MNKNTCDLSASIVLFSNLFDQGNYNNYYNLISEFIKDAVAIKKRWGLNCTELTELLSEYYGFDLPESVVRKTVKEILKSSVSFNGNGHYSFNPKIAIDIEKKNGVYAKIISFQKKLCSDLISFIESLQGKMLPDQKKRLLQDLDHYLLDQGSTAPYIKSIQDFIAMNREKNGFMDSLNEIREAMILYKGIIFTPNIDEINDWKTPLVIFLSAEHLFTALGCNGIVFKSFFDDLYHLADKINKLNRNRSGEKRIVFRYMEETHREFNSFFEKAESSFLGTKIPDPADPSRRAMENLLEGCNTVSEIREKKIRFEIELKRMEIRLEKFNSTIYNYLEYKVDNKELWDYIKKDIAVKWPAFNEANCRKMLDMLTKINSLRQGVVVDKLEDARYILLTNQRQILHLGSNTRVNFAESDIPFAVDIDYLTNSLWGKLKKGFSDEKNPKGAFNVVARTFVVLSDLVRNSVLEKYETLQAQLRDGSLPEQEALARSLAFRDNANNSSVHPYKDLDLSNRNGNHEHQLREIEKLKNQLKEEQRQNATLLESLIQYKSADSHLVYQRELNNVQCLKEKYIQDKWGDKFASVRRDMRYCIGIIFLTTVITLSNFALKEIDPKNYWFQRFGIAFSVIYILLTVREIVGRAYFFDKDRLKNGMKWLWPYCFSRNKYFTLKRNEMEKFEKEFETSGSGIPLPGNEPSTDNFQ